ncbi:MAG TPA: extracellular solute-binding protein, partial [Chloroflexota bacterium]|nr:extracellular solute-binding protein [Chloroflexota bacterium]
QPGKSARPVKLAYVNGHAPASVGAEKDDEQFRIFNQAYPHITVEVVLAGGPGAPGARQKYSALAAAGTAPHLAQNDWGVWLDLARTGTIRELSSFFKADKLSPEAVFLPLPVDQYSHGGVLYGFPISVSSDSFAYNKDLFDREGIPVPPADTADRAWTMERFLEVAQRLNKAGQQAGMLNVHAYHFNRGTWYGRPSWDDAKRQAFVNHPDHIKGQQFWMDLVHRYRVVPTGDEARQLAGGVSNAFLAGKAAMMYTCCPLGLRDVQFKWGLATLPYSGPAGSRNISGRIWPHALHVTRNVPQEEMDGVWTLLKWYMAKPEHAGLMPPSNSHQVAPYKDPRYSDIAQQEFERLTGGVSGKAPLLTAQHTPPSYCGMLKYEEFNEVDEKTKDAWAKVEADQLSAKDWADLAQKAIEDAKLGSRGLG